ncbi:MULTISPECIES: transposase [unclassified Corynebacterium]|uniref:transposase n=1 Tax=unclassified Corynebacterium TaxID=2624378 RepID=UPI001CE3EECE|nr:MULTISPECIES: transposase [unclassified Corynebacterium]MDU1461243.1 transposase [Corynebacterium sp.]MDU7102034.1 transposase [Corynebacterium sp.]
MPKKLEQDAKDRAVRLVEDCILAKNKSIQEACKVVTPNLGVSWHTVRRWAQAARRKGRTTDPLPAYLVAAVAKLRRENQELRETNELLKAAAAFSRQNLAQNVGNDPDHR